MRRPDMPRRTQQSTRRRKSWREAGGYLWRTRKPHALIGLPIIGRHNAYVGETSSRRHRDAQHLQGSAYGAPAKDWADLDPRCYPLPMMCPNAAWARKGQEWLYIKLLLPVYNVKHNGTNPRRITPAQARAQRAARGRARVHAGVAFNVGRAMVRLVVTLAVLALAAKIGWEFTPWA